MVLAKAKEVGKCMPFEDMANGDMVGMRPERE